MRRRILEGLHLVKGARDDLAVPGYDGPNGHLFPGGSPVGLAKGFAHEKLVTSEIDNGFHVKNGLRVGENTLTIRSLSTFSVEDAP